MEYFGSSSASNRTKPHITIADGLDEGAEADRFAAKPHTQ
jgi:hypothetical protein